MFGFFRRRRSLLYLPYQWSREVKQNEQKVHAVSAEIWQCAAAIFTTVVVPQSASVLLTQSAFCTVLVFCVLGFSVLIFILWDYLLANIREASSQIPDEEVFA